MQAQMGSAAPSSSTSQAWQDPIRQPVGMVTPAREATCSRGSPTSASTVTLSGKNWMDTRIQRPSGGSLGLLEHSDQRMVGVFSSFQGMVKSDLYWGLGAVYRG